MKIKLKFLLIILENILKMQVKRIIKLEKLETFKYKKGNINKKIPAIFLDKDGVINKLNKNKHYQDINKFEVNA